VATKPGRVNEALHPEWLLQTLLNES
jgi:hypothetical protein